MTHSLRPGLSTRQRYDVADTDTAEALGSGSLPVLGTPRLLAWCEAATCAAVDGVLPAGSTSVGTSLELEHRSPAAVGEIVDVEATLTDTEGHALTFAVDVVDDGRREIAHGKLTRVVVDEDRFMGGLKQTRPG